MDELLKPVIMDVLVDRGTHHLTSGDVITVSELAVHRYQRGSRIEGTSVEDLRTHPDLVEQAEILAERFRVMWQDEQNDGLEDALMSVAHDYVDPDPPGGEPNMEEVDAVQLVALQVVLEMARPLIMRVLDRGDWNEHE